MRALSVREPWVAQILAGTKRVEYRSWRLPAARVGEWIALHRSRRAPAIVGLVRFAPQTRDGEWRIAEVLRLGKDIPCGGALSFWRVPDTIARRLDARVYRAAS